MTSFAIRALDARLRIVAPPPIGPVLADAFTDLVAKESDPSDAVVEIVWRADGEGRWQVSFGPGGSASADAAGGLAESIVEINQLAARSVSVERIALHASTFEVDGRAVAVTGKSGSGKSTLVVAAVLRGHGYLADEVCAIDPVNWVVRPYHRPIGLRQQGADALGLSCPGGPSDLFADVYPWRAGEHGRLADRAPLRLLAFIERRPGPVVVEPLAPADALVALTTASLGEASDQRTLFRRLDRLVRNVELVTIGFDDSFAAVDALVEAVCR